MAEVTRLITGFCPRGHRRTPETARIRRDNGSISCRVCQRIRQQRARQGLPSLPRPTKFPQFAEANRDRAEVRIEEIEFMLEGGGRPKWGSWPWGNSAEALTRFLYRRDRRDLVRRFASQAKRERTERERAERKAA